MLKCIYIFAWIICIASQVLFGLSSKREKGLWTWVGPNSPPVRDILELAFVEGVLLDMGELLDTRKEHQATREPWGVSLHGEGGLSLGCLCLVGSLLGHTTIPYLGQSSFISLSQKKMWT